MKFYSTEIVYTYNTKQYNQVTKNVNNGEILSTFFKFSHFCSDAIPNPKKVKC